MKKSLVKQGYRVYSEVDVSFFSFSETTTGSSTDFWIGFRQWYIKGKGTLFGVPMYVPTVLTSTSQHFTISVRSVVTITKDINKTDYCFPFTD